MRISSPGGELDGAKDRSFCAWCTAWETNGDIEGVGYLEPNPDAKLPSHEQDAWLQELEDLPQLQNNLGKLDEEDSGPTPENESRVAEHYPDMAVASLDDGGSKSPDPVQSTCFLCGKIWSTFLKWATQKFGSHGRVDLSTSRIEVGGLWPKRLPEEEETVDDYTGYTDDGIHGRLCLVQITVTPYAARRRPLTADLRLFRKLKALCTAMHGGNCWPGRVNFGSRPLPSIRLIDVDRMCLIETDNIEAVVWVALSELVLEVDIKEPKHRGEYEVKEEAIYALQTDDGLKLDVMWDQYPPPCSHHEQHGDKGCWKRRVECIVIGRNSLERLRGRGQLSILIAKRYPSGGLAREGHVTVWEDDWNRLPDRKWELVFLV
ncbi:hypothetical protein V8F06_013165 [Rhypophila decipiens]